MKSFLAKILELTVFSCGAVVMIFELVGSRILGPYFGTSTFVWTSLIGIILGCLAIGYYWGGKLADRKSDLQNLSLLIFFSSLFMILILFVKEPFLETIRNLFTDLRFGSILAAIGLFSGPSILLGMVSPYAAKLKLKNLETSGAEIGRLYALSTFGSILGTFAAGFWLIPFFGTNKLLLILGAILALNSLLLFWQDRFFGFKISVFYFFIFSLIFFNSIGLVFAKPGVLDFDSQYNRIWVFDYLDQKTGKQAKLLGINKESHSAMFLDSEELVFEYTKYYRLAEHFFPNFKKVLMIGGGGYSVPKDFLKKYLEMEMSVVEIDPKVTELARQYFRLSDDLRLKIFHEDGRTFLNQTDEKFDVILGDAFSSKYSLPYHLTTLEAVRKKYEILNDNGVVILNIISGGENEFLRAEYATYKKIFPQVYLFPNLDKSNLGRIQNIILVALKSEMIPVFNSGNPELDGYLKNLYSGELKLDLPILTDDYAPVDYYVSKTI